MDKAGERLAREQSELLGPQQGVGQIEQQAERHEAGERIVEDHRSSPGCRADRGRAKTAFEASEPLAGVGVADRQRKEAQAQGQHDDIPHETTPSAYSNSKICIAFRERSLRSIKSDRLHETRALPVAVVTKCADRHRFSRRSQPKSYMNLIKITPGARVPVRRPTSSSMPTQPTFVIQACHAALCETVGTPQRYGLLLLMASL